MFARFVARIPNLKKYERNIKAGKSECARETRKNISHERPSLFHRAEVLLSREFQGRVFLSWRQGQAGPGKRDK